MKPSYNFQGKFQKISKNGDNGINRHGYKIGIKFAFLKYYILLNFFAEASPLVVLNALGFIGFKVITVAGNIQVCVQYSFRKRENFSNLHSFGISWQKRRRYQTLETNKEV